MFHVVCHDCTAEILQPDEMGAKTLTEMHREETGHGVEYAEVA